MIQKIAFQDIFKVIDLSNNPDKLMPFQISFISFDNKRNTGGKKITIKNAVRCKENHQQDIHIPSAGGFARNPFHSENQTVNILDLDDVNKHPIKVHYRLIVELNHKIVMY